MTLQLCIISGRVLTVSSYMNDGITSLYQVIESPFLPRGGRRLRRRARRPRARPRSCGVRTALLHCAVFCAGADFKSAPSGALRGWAPTRVPLLHRRTAAQKLKMYGARLGRPARSVAAAFPRRRGHPSLRLGRPAAPRRRGRLPPRCACPPRRRPAAGAVLLSRKGVASRCAALALACAPRCAPPRPLPSSRGLRLRCGASSLASAWARARRAGGLRAPPCRPSGLRCAFAPSAGPCRAGFARAFFCLRPPPRKGFCRRCGGDGEKPLRRLICVDTGSTQRACARLFIARSYPSKRQPRCFLSSQDKISAQALSD